MNFQPFINSDFYRTIYHHLVGNVLLKETESPLILGIFGPPGEGKTFQTEEVCKSLGVTLLAVSPGELESPNAGQPGELLRTLYLQASEAIKSGKPSIVLINDIDTVLGDWGSLVQYTVNRQVVFGQLMAFCDYPNSVSGQNNVARVPVIVTGNDPTTLYEPLLRPGRTRVFPWAPTPEDRCQVLRPMFPEISEASLVDLVTEFPERPISFWGDARAAAWESALSRWAMSQEPQRVMSLIRANRRVSLEGVQISAEQLQGIARSMVARDVRNVSYLAKRN
jgi:ATPase family associated with various cellular activities (AAA)